MESKGIVNEGNNCFLNAVLQLIQRCEPFADFLLNHPSSARTPLISELQACLLKWAHCASPLNLLEEKQKIMILMNGYGSQLEFGTQNDAHETLMKILEIVDFEINGTASEYTLDPLFLVTTGSHFSCTSCNTETLNNRIKARLLAVTVCGQTQLQREIDGLICSDTTVNCICGASEFTSCFMSLPHVLMFNVSSRVYSIVIMLRSLLLLRLSPEIELFYLGGVLSESHACESNFLLISLHRGSPDLLSCHCDVPRNLKFIQSFELVFVIHHIGNNPTSGHYYVSRPSDSLVIDDHIVRLQTFDSRFSYVVLYRQISDDNCIPVPPSTVASQTRSSNGPT